MGRTEWRQTRSPADARRRGREQAVRAAGVRGSRARRILGPVAIGLLLMGGILAADAPPAAGAADAGAHAASDRPSAHAAEVTAAVRQGGDVSASAAAAATRTTAGRPPAPIRPTLWYRTAAVEHAVSPLLLEALHQVESSASPDSCIANLEGSGATGPFQFKPATFAQVGVDANGDGIADICGFADSLVSAARYLRALGADGDPASPATRAALRRYGTDVGLVVALAHAYRERDRHEAPARGRT